MVLDLVRVCHDAILLCGIIRNLTRGLQNSAPPVSFRSHPSCRYGGESLRSRHMGGKRRDTWSLSPLDLGFTLR
jgi:hypothetical protein